MENEEQAVAEYLKAQEKFDLNEYSAAYEILVRIMKKYPEFAGTYHSLGWLFTHKIGDLQQALKYYTKCLELNSSYIKAYPSYVYLLNLLQDSDTLEKVLNNAKDLPGLNKVWLLQQYASMYEQRMNFDKAIEYYIAALEYDENENAVEFFENAIKRCEKKKEILSEKKVKFKI